MGVGSRGTQKSIAKANINTTIGELFLANILTVGKFSPLQAPAMPAAGGVVGPSKEIIMEELAKDNREPPRQLALHENGCLVIPIG